MNSKEYFNKSRKIGTMLNKQFESFCKLNNYKEISQNYLQKNIHFNGTQFVAGFSSTGREIYLGDILITPIAIEHIMLKAYKTNALIDEKQSVWKEKKITKKTIYDEVHMTSLLEQLRINAKEIYDINEKLFLDNIFSKMISSISKGFIVEQDINCQKNSMSNVLKNWDEKYRKRNILFNLVYDYSPLIGYALASKNTSIIEDYELTVPQELRLSYVGQVINDFSDFSLEFDSIVKNYSDRLADLRNGVMTLPIHELYEYGALDDYIDNPNLIKNKKWQKELVNRLLENNIDQKIIQLGKDSYVANINFWKEQGVENEFLNKTYALTTCSKYLKLK